MNNVKDAAKLTIEEQAAITSGSDNWHLKPIEDKGIPDFRVSDGPHGLRKVIDTYPNGVHIENGVPSTCFPPAAGLASSWNPALEKEVGKAIGEECVQEHVSVLLGPGVNMKRNPLNGRCFEYWSEDPVCAGHQAAAFVEGIQSAGVGTSLKHFAVNNQETNRFTVSAEVSERALREIYLPAFEYVVKHAHPWTVMCSYNKVNGVYSSQNHWLLTDLLRGEWGFDGLVMSDWGAVHDRVAALNAGLNLQMPGSTEDDALAVNAVRAGGITAGQLQDMAQGILDLIEKARPAMAKKDYRYDGAAHDEIAHRAAVESIVLLKNDGLLPLKKENSIAVIGEFARTPRYQGGGSAHVMARKVVSVLDAFKKEGVKVDFAPGFTFGEEPQEAKLTKQAIDAAKSHDIVALFLGLPEEAESEGRDRTTLEIPSKQIELLNAIAEVNKNIVVVLSNGAVVTVDSWQSKATALMEAWVLGEKGGSATVDILLGKASPSGKLTESIPQKIEDIPNYETYPGGEGIVLYNDDIFVGYRHYDTKKIPVSYPFGFGLSYTTFDMDNVQVVASGRSMASIEMDVTNTGKVSGSETVQIYVAPPKYQGFAPVPRPVHELKEFQKINLAPGETKHLSFTLDSRAFAYWSTESTQLQVATGVHHHEITEAPTAPHQWRVAAGDYTIEIGRSSREILVEKTVTIKGDIAK